MAAAPGEDDDAPSGGGEDAGESPGARLLLVHAIMLIEELFITQRRRMLETKQLVQEAYDTCYKTLTDNMSLMQTVVDELVENETVDAPTFPKLVLQNSLDPKQAVAAL